MTIDLPVLCQRRDPKHHGTAKTVGEGISKLSYAAHGWSDVDSSTRAPTDNPSGCQQHYGRAEHAPYWPGTIHRGLFAVVHTFLLMLLCSSLACENSACSGLNAGWNAGI